MFSLARDIRCRKLGFSRSSVTLPNSGPFSFIFYFFAEVKMVCYISVQVRPQTGINNLILQKNRVLQSGVELWKVIQNGDWAHPNVHKLSSLRIGVIFHCLCSHVCALLALFLLSCFLSHFFLQAFVFFNSCPTVKQGLRAGTCILQQ